MSTKLCDTKKVLVTQLGEGIYRLCFPQAACDNVRGAFEDINSFHDLDVDPDACVPGGFIIGAIGGRVSHWRTGAKVRRLAVTFLRPVLVGGSIIVTFFGIRPEGRFEMVDFTVVSLEGKSIGRDLELILTRIDEAKATAG